MSRKSKTTYKVIWDIGLSQGGLSKTEALKIAAELLKDHDNVKLQKEKS